MKALYGICILLVIFMFAVFAPPASAFEVHTASVGLTTAPMEFAEFSDYSTDALYDGLTLDAEFDMTLADDIPGLGSVATEVEVSYSNIDLTELDEFTGRNMEWRAGLFAQPFEWLRAGPIFSQDESSRAIQVEYAVRIGKHF